MIQAFAPAKAILFGEHAVVYGYPAVASALNLFVKVTVKKLSESKLLVETKHYNLRWSYPKRPPEPLKPLYRILEVISSKYDLNLDTLGFYIEITSDIPPACGLGTSAATAVATSSAILYALGYDPSYDEINSIAYEAEKITHGKPSGIDNTIATYGGIIKYIKESSGPSIERIHDPPDLRFVLVDTGIPRSTKKAVLRVYKLRERNPSIINSVLKTIGFLTEEAWCELRKGNKANLEKIGELMNINHGLLSAIKVSSAKIEEIVYLLRKNGALGAKLTGAGIGGFVLGLISKENEKKITKILSRNKYRFFISSINKDGIKVVNL